MILQRKRIKVSRANTKDGTLRMSIPKQFVEVLNLEAGDKVEWRLNLIDDKVVITVVKAD